MGPTWTPQRVARAVRLYLHEGFSASEVADALGGLTRGAVISKVRRLGLLKRETCQPAPRRAALRLPKCGDRTAVRPRLPPQPPPKPLPPLREVEAEGSAPCRLAELGPDQCRWPLDDPGSGRMHLARFCAAPAGPDVYCPAHRAIATSPRRTRAERRESQPVALA